MIRQRTERFKTHLETVPSLSGTLVLPRGIAWVIACVLILAGVLYVTSGTSTQTMEPLFGGRPLRDLEMDQVEMAFSKSGLSDWSRDEGRIQIPRDTRHEYLAALEQASALPYALRKSVQESSAVGSYFESESARKMRLQKDKATDLGNKIAAFDDIVWASVDYDQQSAGGFDGRVIQSASVLLVSKSGKPISPGRISMIQNLVAGSYAGMEAEQVTVTDTSARKTYNGSEDPLTRLQRQAEYELEQRLTELLSGYRGLRIAARSVYSDREYPEDVPDGKPMLIPKSVARDSQTAQFEMRVSIGVPESQFHAQWINDYRSQHPQISVVEAPTPDQMAGVQEKVMATIRDAVSPLVASRRGPDDQAIQVWSFTDSVKPPSYSPLPSEAGGLATIISSAKTNAAIAVPMAALLLIAIVFWTAAQRMRVRHNPAGTGAPEESANALESQHHPQQPNSVSPHEETTLRDDLAELVESNPELAAQIVHSWIADAA